MWRCLLQYIQMHVSISELLQGACPLKEIEKALPDDSDHFCKNFIFGVKFFDTLCWVFFVMIPRVSDNRANPVEHLAHFEVLAQQYIFDICWDGGQLDCNRPICFTLVVFIVVCFHLVQFSFKEQIQVIHFHLVLLQAYLHLIVYVVNVLQKIIQLKFESSQLVAPLNKAGYHSLCSLNMLLMPGVRV